MLYMKFGYNRPSSFRGEVIWNCGRTDDRQTTHDGACLYYKLPRSLRLRWAKKGGRARSRNGKTHVSLFSTVYIFIKFHGSHSKIWCVADDKHWAKVSKMGITEKKGLKLKTLTLMDIYISIWIHIFNLKKNPSNGLRGVSITNFF